MQGQQGFSTSASDYNAQDFQIRQQLMRINTAEPVKVQSVNTAARTVDVLPLVNIVGGGGDAIVQSEIFDLPYLRIQGGKNAVIIDPQPGDVGLAVYAMRDVEAVKAAPGQPVNPASARSYDKGDGFYLGGFLNAEPERYLRITDEGVEIEGVASIQAHGKEVTITADTQITLDAPTVQVTGVLVQTGEKGSGQSSFHGGFTNTGGTVSSNGVTLETHTHSGVETGSGNTGSPNK